MAGVRPQVACTMEVITGATQGETRDEKVESIPRTNGGGFDDDRAYLGQFACDG
jgi:hypothetical protein